MNMASVASVNGAPRMAPTPTSSVASVDSRPVRIGPMMAMTGIRVSGNAVATAARTLPTAPSPKFRRWPNHSMPFVNSSAPMRMTASATTKTRISMRDPARNPETRGPRPA